ncbi:MAG TPA: acetyltransferase [Bacteroidales bacterium]|nr:MAG: hypothetical protein A2X11_00670 [Bacteroidetes bacterium GWE2_42_24]PKP27830.1 MAG: acetyltransferase [Bacteroidetes bacterium HGW-Bacteroidetes-22]HBZ66042.1 acetyltransferase [Bacteroidales bacterium]
MLQFLWITFVRVLNPTCKIRAASLGRSVIFGKGVTVESGSHIIAARIDDYTYINKNCQIDRSVVSIGRFCSIAYNVKIGLGNHPTGWVSTHPFAYEKKYGFVKTGRAFEEQALKSTIIGNDVWIGANSTILAGVTIGHGAIVGAHSLVTCDVEPYSIVVGTPARHLRYRFEAHTIDRLLKSAWWNMDYSKLKKSVSLMDNPDNFLDSISGGQNPADKS